METTYDVRIWKTEKRQRTKGASHRVLWRVGTERFRKSFGNAALAESFRGDLLAAAGRGEAFRLLDGLPVSAARRANERSWFKFACDYMDFIWRDASPGHRRNAAEALTTITFTMLGRVKGQPPTDELRRAALCALNRNAREHPEDEAKNIDWLLKNTRPVADLEDDELVHSVLAGIGTKLDGQKCATSTYRRKRMTLTHALDYAVTCKLLSRNSLPGLKSTAPSSGKAIRQVDRRSVVNPIQARTLLNAVKELGQQGDELVAFFACMYFAALRPEEAACLGKQNLSLPERGGGTLYLEQAAPDIAAQWTDTGTRTEKRALKHREAGETRPVPCPPELTAHLQRHLSTHGVAADGRIFRGTRSQGRLSSSVYGRVWAQAREHALTPQMAASPLARRPYDLRHACVSTWLAAGIQPARVAEWAGHSIAVLMQVYARCLDGGEQHARSQLDAFLGWSDAGTDGEQTAGDGRT
jgi:integrase